MMRYYWFRFILFLGRHRFLTTGLGAFGFVVLLDQIFHHWVFDAYASAFQWWMGYPIGGDGVDLGYAPEVWLALIAMILGTLIIVISIASQSIPKLIDLYMQDWWSLLYAWFLIASITHALVIITYGDMGLSRLSSQILNIHVLLGSSLLVALPYIFYILERTKPSDVIQQISKTTQSDIRFLGTRQCQVLCQNPQLVEGFQFRLFEALNQLADLVEYVSFKEPKAEIIQQISASLQEYIRIKPEINKEFFKISPKVQSDISFKTMVGQFSEFELNETFYEQKCFRILSNIYILLLERNDFELASLCASQFTAIGRAAIEKEDIHVMDAIIIRFNTTLRFAIKHGVKHNEARNLYNAAFHYGGFIANLVEAKYVEHVQRSFFYLRNYGTEVLKHGRNSPAMYFIVDVFAAEMKRVLLLTYSEQLSHEVQNGLLSELLLIDSPADMQHEDKDQGQLLNNGVRVLQMGLALFYQREGLSGFVNRIIDDVLEDFEYLGEKVFRQVIDRTCLRLMVSGPSFWEDTDRGTVNIYYSADQDQIEVFKEFLYEKMSQKIISSSQTS